jgi:peptide/nickel transport system permease protein
MRELFQRLTGSPAGLVAAGFIVLLIAVTIIVPLINGLNPMTISSNALFPPSAQHLLGTDELGRDVLQLLIHGVRVSLSVGLLSALVASVLGVLIGAWAGYFGGRIDMFLMRIAEIFQVLPTFVLAAVIVAMLGPGTTRVIAVIAILAWPQIALVMRSEVYRVKQIDFVDAVRCLGYSEIYILVREVVPNALRSVVALGTLIVGQAILIEASLSFLGLSSPDVISWGGMLNSGQRYLFNAWWLSVLPGIAIFLTVLAFNFIGDALNAALNPKDTGR